MLKSSFLGKFMFVLIMIAFFGVLMIIMFFLILFKFFKGVILMFVLEFKFIL